MKSGSLLYSLLFVAFIACSKDKFQTKPQLKFKSKNTAEVAQNGTLRITLEYTDKEGDVDDSLLMVRERLNQRGPVILPASPYLIPKFPDITKGEFEITLTYQFGLIFGLSLIRIPGSNPARNEPDTLNLKFVARDKAGNKSDTLTVSNIIVIR
jgi:hypothetical protein